MEARPVTALAIEEFIAAAALSPGQVVKLPDGRAGVVCANSPVASGSRYSAYTAGDFEFAVDTATTLSVGQEAQWDEGDNEVVAAGGVGDFRIGLVKEAKTSGQVWVRIDLNAEALEIGDKTYHIRKRFTIAQINAGATLLAAEANVKYRMVDAAMIAVGGAAAAATTIDILAMQSESSVKLVANAVAGLTQNTLLRAGATNSAILAAGVSFVANDVNTAITVGKTGSDVTTATHIDVLLTYTKDFA